MCINDSTTHSVVKDYHFQHAICHHDPFSMPKEFCNVIREIIAIAAVVLYNLTSGIRLESN